MRLEEGSSHDRRRERRRGFSYQRRLAPEGLLQSRFGLQMLSLNVATGRQVWDEPRPFVERLPESLKRKARAR
jgi:hypothetical protein